MWLEEMARRNEQRLGTGPLDCCNLNQQSQRNHKSQQNQNHSTGQKSSPVVHQ